MTYKFEQFKTEINDPTIEVVNVTDNLQAKTCSVDILLSTDTSKFGIVLDGFNYSDTWEDIDIENWVSLELKKFEA